MSTPVAAPISPAAPSVTPPSAPSNPAGSLGKNDFLKLLVAQMKNQDPMDPLKGQDLAAQMAQFSSVEQLISINQALTGQAAESTAIAAAINLSTATGAIGKTITATGNSVAVTNGEKTSVTVDVAGAGGNAVVHVFDSAGHEVGTRSDLELLGGRQTIALESATAGLPTGVYTYRVDVTDAAGKAVTVTPYVVATIDSIRYTENGPVLGAGGMSIPFGSVIEIGSPKP
jgi:flagellar basal-body rod modification protein FlgD